MKIYKVIALSIIILLLVIIPLKLNIKNDNTQNHLFFEKILDIPLPASRCLRHPVPDGRHYLQKT